MKKFSKIMAAALAIGMGFAATVHAATLNGAGATFPYPIYSKWFYEYNKQAGVKINYQSIGSGGGIRQVSEGTVDFGAMVDGYCSDMTRTIHMGRATAAERNAYDAVLEAQEAGVAAVRAGVTVDQFIAGAIKANGQIMMINQNGIVFANGGGWNRSLSGLRSHGAVKYATRDRKSAFLPFMNYGFHRSPFLRLNSTCDSRDDLSSHLLEFCSIKR